MLEPFSLSLCAGGMAIAAAARASSAVSQEAKIVSRQVTELQHRHEASHSLFGRKAQAISQLRSVVVSAVEECDTEAGEIWPSSIAISNAENLLRALPDDVPLPEFSVEPDGAIALDWMQSRSQMVSVSVSERDRLAYAWLDGTDRGHAVLGLRANAVPLPLLALIRSITAHGNTAFLRAASAGR